jgi:hypothetical protein
VGGAGRQRPAPVGKNSPTGLCKASAGRLALSLSGRGHHLELQVPGQAGGLPLHPALHRGHPRPGRPLGPIPQRPRRDVLGPSSPGAFSGVDVTIGAGVAREYIRLLLTLPQECQNSFGAAGFGLVLSMNPVPVT